jgi:hypothetical protein
VRKQGMRTLSAAGRARVVLSSSFPAPCVDNFSDCDFSFVMPVANKRGGGCTQISETWCVFLFSDLSRGKFCSRNKIYYTLRFTLFVNRLVQKNKLIGDWTIWAVAGNRRIAIGPTTLPLTPTAHGAAHPRLPRPEHAVDDEQDTLHRSPVSTPQ